MGTWVAFDGPYNMEPFPGNEFPTIHLPSVFFPGGVKILYSYVRKRHCQINHGLFYGFAAVR